MPTSTLKALFRENTSTEFYFVQPDLQDSFLYIGKHRPEVYLSERVREGSSTFRVVAEKEEIKEGCERLAADLASWKFDDVYASYENNIGDYTFLRATTH